MNYKYKIASLYINFCYHKLLHSIIIIYRPCLINYFMHLLFHFVKKTLFNQIVTGEDKAM